MTTLPEEAVKAAERLPQAEKEITRYQQERERWINYTIDLQRIIEALCDRRGLPEPISTARHHYDMAREYLSSRAGNTVPALEPSAARSQALERISKILRGDVETDTIVTAVNRLNAAIDIALRALSSPDHADAVRERAWYFSAGDTVPEWLEKIEKGNCTMTFGVDVVVTSKDGGYEVRPQGIADNAGPILHVVNQGNVTPEIKGGGNGVAIIGYNRPYDETAEGKIERLKRLLEMARPYVECYDTREHNAEQDAVLTEIDKALSVVVGEPHPDAGKLVEGDGIERAKFYHHQWPMERLLAARRDGLVDHSGGEAWRYEYSHKDEHGKYDILYRPVKNSTIPARLPSAPSEGAE